MLFLCFLQEHRWAVVQENSSIRHKMRMYHRECCIRYGENTVVLKQIGINCFNLLWVYKEIQKLDQKKQEDIIKKPKTFKIPFSYLQVQTVFFSFWWSVSTVNSLVFKILWDAKILRQTDHRKWSTADICADTV